MTTIGLHVANEHENSGRKLGKPRLVAAIFSDMYQQQFKVDGSNDPTSFEETIPHIHTFFFFAKALQLRVQRVMGLSLMHLAPATLPMFSPVPQHENILSRGKSRRYKRVCVDQ